MHDRRGVGRGQRRRRLDADVKDLAKRQRSALETLAHGFALDEFRYQESCGVVIADLVDRQDVGMIERRCGPSLVKKAGEAFRIAAELAAQDFQSHRPSEGGIERLVNCAHAAAAQQALNLIAADGGSCTQRHRRVRLYRRDGRRQSSGSLPCRRSARRDAARGGGRHRSLLKLTPRVSISHQQVQLAHIATGAPASQMGRL